MSKRILMLHASSDMYGASKIFISAIETLRADGLEVIAVLSEEGPLTEALRSKEIEVVIIRLGILRRKYFHLSGLFNRATVLSKAYRELKSLIQEREIDIVYSQTSAVLIGAIVAKGMKRPHIWQVLEITEKPYWFFRLMAFIINRYSQEIIVASQAVKDHWKKFIPENKLHPIHYGIDSSEFVCKGSTLKSELGLSESALVVGMVGRVHYWKGQDYFLRIAGKIAREFPEVHFVMIGDVFPGYEYLYASLDQIAGEEGLKGKLKDLGFRKDVANLICGFDIFVQPSILPDPFPTVILESMSASRTVVATGLGGAKEMIRHGWNGYLIPLNNPDEAFNIIRPLLLDKHKRDLIGTEARKTIETEFSLQNYQTKFSRFVKQFVADYPAEGYRKPH